MTISLRPYAPADAEALHAGATESIADVHPWLPWCHPGYALEEARAWIDAQVAAFAEEKEYEFAILGSGGHYAGGCGVNQVVRAERRANLGYWVRSSAMGQGVAVAAARLAAAWAFQHTDLERLEIVVAVGNVRSQRVAEKVGAVREGVLRRRLLLHGVFHDAVGYAIVRGDQPPTSSTTAIDTSAAMRQRPSATSTSSPGTSASSDSRSRVSAT